MLSLFFLLKDGPSLRRGVERHLGVPQPVARTITSDVITALQRYFAGVTIVATFNAVIVGVGALLLGVPLVGTIMIVTFVCAFIPYLGAFVAGAFAVLIALGSQGTTAAVIMLVIVLLANGSLQQIMQPIAYGATLGLNPLIVLIVTIGAGSLFGMLGLVVAAPLTSAAVHIKQDVERARAAAAGTGCDRSRRSRRSSRPTGASSPRRDVDHIPDDRLGAHDDQILFILFWVGVAVLVVFLVRRWKGDPTWPGALPARSIRATPRRRRCSIAVSRSGRSSPTSTGAEATRCTRRACRPAREQPRTHPRATAESRPTSPTISSLSRDSGGGQPRPVGGS